MKIMITGGAGFIGSHLADRLIAEGNIVVVVDNYSLGSERNLEQHRENSNFRLYKCDILDFPEMEKIFRVEKFDVVFHLAANSDIAISHMEPNIDMHNTFMTTYNILTLMRKNNVENIVFASTSAIYGDTQEVVAEDFGPLFPVSHYGASKLASEAFIASFVENYGLKAWIVRFPNVIGERATHGVIFDFIGKLRKDPDMLEVLGNGEQIKPYLYVKDLVDAIIFVWENTNENLNYFNIGVESRTKVKEIAKLVIEKMGLKAEIKYSGGAKGWVGDVPEFKYSIDKISQLGWHATMDSNGAVAIAIENILKFDK